MFLYKSYCFFHLKLKEFYWPCQKVVNTAGGNFFAGWWEPKEEWFWRFKPFSKLKTTFCEYLTSIKIKISMTCVSKEYEIKTKMVQEQWLQLKMTFLFFYWVELTFGGEERKILWEFLTSGRDSPHPPQ